MNAPVDAGIRMQTFIIAAESYGPGCCPPSELRNQVQLLSDELALPRHVSPVAGLCVGWPSREGGLSMRLLPSVTVRQDRYDDSALCDEVNAYDRRREALEQTPPGPQRFAAGFGVAENQGRSENRTRQYLCPARADFGACMRRQGFHLS
jgi:nitroreductase/FMN reductase [NAD(P)H]